MTVISLFLYLSFYIVLISAVYGSVMYASLPLNVGGGNPANVIFNFADSDDLEQSGLTSMIGLQTEEMCVLVPLDEGYLVYDPIQSHSTIVKYNAFVSVVDTRAKIDCSPPTILQPVSATSSP